jgi:tricorn protease
LHKTLFILIGFFAIVTQATAQESPRPIRFARHPALSPDGLKLAFSYHGDIWTVASEGGTATRITIHEAHDQLPSWSPDGRWIAFSGKREGNYDIWIIPNIGGMPRQLTMHSADDLVSGWSPDGKEVLFTSSRETTRTSSLYAVSVATGKSRLVVTDDIRLDHATFTPDGRYVVTTRGGLWARKGYRGSFNSSLIRYPAQGGVGEWLVKEAENERWPQLMPDGSSFFYVSDKTGTANLWRRGFPNGRAVQVTQFKDGNLFYPTLSRNGARIAFEHDFGIWTMATRGGEPKEVKIYAPTDDRTNNVKRQTFTTGVQEALLSPNGQQIAFVVHGELFVQPAAGGDTTRLTTTPQREEDIAWSPDSKRIVFASDRDGDQDIYMVDVQTKQTKKLVSTAGVAENSPRFSPNGKSLAFLRGFNGTELSIMAAEGGEARTLVRDPSVDTYTWSPDSKWIAYGRSKSHSAGRIGDVFIVSAAGGKATNVTRYPLVNFSPEWSQDGKKLYFLSDRAGGNQVWSVSLEEEKTDDEAEPRPAPPGARQPAEVKVDFTDIHKRARQMTRGDKDVTSYAVSPDGRTILFTTTLNGRPDLWRTTADGGQATRLTQTGEAGQGLHFAPDGTRVVYRSLGNIRSMALNVPAPAPGPVPVSVRMDIDTRAEMTQLFDEAWRKMRDAFYDEKMHGADWNKVRQVYRPVVADIAVKEDFIALFTLALGELNASHVGIGNPPGEGGSGPSTASLGVALDDSYAGPGVKVKSVMPKGPADKEPSKLTPGDIVLQVDGEPVTGNEQFFSLMADRAGKRIDVVVNKEPKEAGAKTLKMRPITGVAYKALEYDRWTKEREQAVEKLSGGRLGYLHLSAMGPAQLEQFKRAAFSDLQEKDGLVLDLRFNGGGSIADEIFAVLNNRVFGYRTMRGDPERMPSPMPAFNKPVIVLINENSGSNAEVFPWGFKALKLGKVVGVPTLGGVIGTGGTSLIDGTNLRIPAVGSYTLDGKNMENNGTPPDVYVEHTPEDIARGYDRQLERAVQELMRDLPRASARTSGR